MWNRERPLNLSAPGADIRLLEDCNFQFQRTATKHYSAWWRCRFWWLNLIGEWPISAWAVLNDQVPRFDSSPPAKAERLRKEARGAPPGIRRDELLRRAYMIADDGHIRQPRMHPLQG
jgi:hypothetical protein